MQDELIKTKLPTTVEVQSQIQLSDQAVINVKDIIDRGINFLGIRRSGKSYGVGVLCEEFLDKNQPILIIDWEGEYYTLREKYPILIGALHDPYYADLSNLNPESTYQLCKFIVENQQSLILDLSGKNTLERFIYLAKFLESFYKVETELKTPYVLVLDEAHKIIPEKGLIRLKTLKEHQQKVEYWAYEIAVTGGKRGIGLIVATQRSAQVTKMVISQLDIKVVYKLFEPADRGYLKTWLTESQLDKVASFKQGDFVLLGLGNPLFSHTKPRKTTHGGETPELKNKTRIPKMAQAIKELSTILSKAPEPEKDNVDNELVQQLEEKLISKNQTIKDQEKALSESKITEAGQKTIIEEMRHRVIELENQQVSQDKLESLQGEYTAYKHRKETQISELETTIKDLNADLSAAYDELHAVEKYPELLQNLKEDMVEISNAFGIDLFPSDIQEVMNERDEYKKQLEELMTDQTQENEYVTQIINDAYVKDWTKRAQNKLNSFLTSRTNHNLVLKKLIASDASIMYLPEDFVELEVSTTTVRKYLEDFDSAGFAKKTERGKNGRAAYSNNLALWVSNNIRVMYIDAPNAVIDKIVADLKEYVITK